MRNLILLTFLTLISLRAAQATEKSIDSLCSALTKASTMAEQIRICRDLADITYETVAASEYLNKLIGKAKQDGDTPQMMEALIDLSNCYIQLKKIDSARYCLTQVEQLAPAKKLDQWSCLIRMQLFAAELLGENAAEAVDQKIAELQQRDNAGESLCKQIETEYIFGSALYDKQQNDEALKHLHNALTHAKELPFRIGAPYQQLIMRQLARVYNVMRNTVTAYELIKESITLKERYYTQYDKADRPFYPMDDFYINSYGSLMVNVSNMDDNESRYYLNRLVEVSDRSKNPAHKYNRFLAQYNYSVFNRNYRQSLIYNDSLIRYARQIAVYNLPGLYELNAILHEALGENAPALRNLREAHRLKDSIRNNASQEKFDKLRVEYDLNRLNYEKSQLEIHSKRMMLIVLSIILLVVVGLCIFLYHYLRRERRRKEEMQRLMLRAEESERLKTSFINSICHEIRTPLNSIVGFSSLMLEPGINDDERSTFPAEIRSNTEQLISLIDGMLEVASLDVSDEQLTRKPVEITQLCHHVFEKYQLANTNKAIESIICLPDELIVAQTHARYISLVLDNLMDNAFKFTEQGQVTLSCEQREGSLIISVTDTGCGIPLEKHKLVFERFTKLNYHTQGSGLGLYLCKQVMHRLSGQIFIDTEYSQGTRITVILPLS